MPYIVDDCPACGAKGATFDINNFNDCSVYKHFPSIIEFEAVSPPIEYCRCYDLFSICKKCKSTITFVVFEPYDYERDSAINCGSPMDVKGEITNTFEMFGIVRVCDNVVCLAPDFTPKDIEKTFKEGTKCLSIKCWNAAGAMFRKCLDLTAKDKLAEKDHGKKLSVKVKCLLAEKILPEDLKEIANYIILDGNDGLHNRMLTKDDAVGLLEFTVMLLGRIYTEPERIKRMTKKRDERKKAKS